jgi:nitroreductase
MEPDREGILGAILARRSIRKFDQSRKVEREKAVELLKMAMAAPSACNIQPWDFVVIQDGEAIREIQGSIRQYGDYDPSLIIVVCGNDEHIPWKDHGSFDCAAAMENMMIAAPALGLGTVCIGGFDRGWMKSFLGLPPSVEAMGLLYAGYPAEEKEPRTKYLEEAVHWERYDSKRSRGPRNGDILAFGPEASI